MQVAVEIGKFTLESLTSGMYSSAKDLYREYIQNCADSIDNAIDAGLIHSNDAHINICINKNIKQITIKDNGTGLSVNSAVKHLMDIGNSYKLYSVNRGFRGIGRLAGISYCSRLTFTTSTVNEIKKTVLTFDCKRLKELLVPGAYMEYDLSTVLSEVTTVQVLAEKAESHYFQVMLDEVEDLDGLLNEYEVKEYLSEVAPLPYHSDAFKWGKEINDKLSTKGIPLCEYRIFLSDAVQMKQQLYKMNCDKFISDRTKMIYDEIKNIEIVDILDNHGNVQAVLWYSITNFYGSISDETKKGLRLRKGNIQIGDKNTLNCIFREERFNGWFQGEVFILDEKIIPNARRDNFEKNIAYLELIKKLSHIGEKLSKQIRNISYQRNSKSNKALNDAESLIKKVDSLVSMGFNSFKEKETLTHEIEKTKSGIQVLRVKDELNISRKNDIFKQLDILTNNVKGATNFKILNLSKNLTSDQKKLIEKVFETITENCERKDADRLINEIMKKFN